MVKCPYCQCLIEEVYRTTTCPQCKKELHTCKACEFYSPGSHYDCRESIDEIVIDKDKSNFCDFFRLTSKTLRPNNKSSQSREALDKLFNL